jgi:hypothetical protein
MIIIKKDQIIPEEYIVFIIGNRIVNKYISAGNNMVIKKIDKDTIHISFHNKKKINILSSVMKLDAKTMRNDGIDIIKNNLLNYPNIVFRGNCSRVCQFELLDDIYTNQSLH